MESILTSVKKHVGIEAEYEYFDIDIIDGINSAFSILNQLGVGPRDGYMITGSEENWSDYLPQGQLQNLIRQYVPLKVKQIFDPSSSGNVSDAVQSRIDELEWRIKIQVEILDGLNDEGGTNNDE